MAPQSRQRFTTATAVADYLGVTGKTVRAWIRAGILTASQVQSAHYTDDRPRKTRRGSWRIGEADLLDFLNRFMVHGRATKEPGLPRWLLRVR